MASLLSSFDPPANGSVVQRTTNGNDANGVSDADDRDNSPDVTRQESTILLGSNDAKEDDGSKRQALYVRKTRSGGHKTYMATESQIQMV